MEIARLPSIQLLCEEKRELINTMPDKYEWFVIILL
jgi:hypothetical protein